MERAIRFVCNREQVTTASPPGMVVLDFLRNERGLLGTKAACREGDCGSCTVLVGTNIPGEKRVRYRAVTSCLLPLGDIEGKHLVSIEGLNLPHTEDGSPPPLNPIQRLFVEEGATQCGFCTPGFIVSLTYFFLEAENLDYESAIDAVAGNICRCTGYGAIRRAVRRLVDEYGVKMPARNERVEALIKADIVPEYFSDIPAVLGEMSGAEGRAASSDTASGGPAPGALAGTVLVAGGTDLYVQKPDILVEEDVRFVSRRDSIDSVAHTGTRFVVGAGVPTEDLKQNRELAAAIPGWREHLGLIASAQIRQRATVGGNIVNASPIGDLAVYFLALGTEVKIEKEGAGLGDDGAGRMVRLEDFFLGYKKLDLKPGEAVKEFIFTLPEHGGAINFEKVSRRTHLDIASVNSAVRLETANEKGVVKILSARLAAGGVAPVPLLLRKTGELLAGNGSSGNKLTAELVKRAAETADGEINPITDIRGSAEYKRLLLRQLIYAHFVTLFPEQVPPEDLFDGPAAGGAA